MARYAIRAPKVFGVSVASLRRLAKQYGPDHELALALWRTGWHEARMLTAFIAVPERVTTAQMDRWARDFDNWAICDTLCFHLFDHTPHAWEKVAQWSREPTEFVKRAAFALLASLAVHDKAAADGAFRPSLRLIERAARDERNFVKKSVSWALRSIGNRSDALNSAACEVSERLASSSSASARWIGRDARRALRSPATRLRLRRRRIGAVRAGA